MGLPAASKQIGYGTSIAFNSSSGSTTYTTLAGIDSIEGPDAAAEDIETTTLDTTGGFKTFKKGFVDGQEVTLTLAWSSTDTSQKKLATLFKNRTERSFKITYPTTAWPAETFSGYVKSMGRTGINRTGMITRNATIKVIGSPGFTST